MDSTGHDLLSLQRINVIGLPGSGKSTLSRQLADRLNSVHVEVDGLNWEANWTCAPREIRTARIDNALPPNGSWICDGNYIKSRDIIWTRAQTVIWLDYSLSFTLWRLIRRTLSRMFFRTKLWKGNVESFKNLFSLDPEKNIIVWTLQKHKTRIEDTVPDLESEEYQHLKVLRFKTAKETERWFDTLPVIKS